METSDKNCQNVYYHYITFRDNVGPRKYIRTTIKFFRLISRIFSYN